ncbi:hypothetical protein TRSC58_07447 [Trypanosoma rangeli SC58]|uniref:Uncharacterized protein n=1 Tax=Trypanosoma rangeli SC58 TaxID=429131 RepID=A0A061IRZ2_TRYRA|nr:hypothetical protein TRSC58_07447 [Trypanosoma rangeli SC58]
MFFFVYFFVLFLVPLLLSRFLLSFIELHGVTFLLHMGAHVRTWIQLIFKGQGASSQPLFLLLLLFFGRLFLFFFFLLPQCFTIHTFLQG